jgi:hypothetical protein
VLASGAVFAESTAAKKELVAKVLQLQQPAIELVARAMAEQPAQVLMQRAGPILQQRIPPDKRQAVAQDIQADVKKYVEDTVPLVRERAVALAPSTIGVLLDERFTEEELTQLIAIIESPVNRKFQQLGSEMQKSLGRNWSPRPNRSSSRSCVNSTRRSPGGWASGGRQGAAGAKLPRSQQIGSMPAKDKHGLARTVGESRLR